ncbi:MAG: diguanylate cyclase [Burkholderiales bacterium]|nr:diguanylate cyclase [Burkholderiales bacterium]
MATHGTANAMPLARRAWNLLHVHAQRAHATARRALDAARATGDARARGWARLALGVHGLYYATAAEAARELRRAERDFQSCGDRAGWILARAAIARSMWRQGQFAQALALVLPLRDEGLRVLRHEQRGVLLNTIAGCYSAYGDSAQAFAYMFEALHDAGPRRGRGFDTVLHCNLSHELMQIGDCEEALRHVERGLERCRGLDNPRLLAVLRINRVVCLTELGRPAQALPDIAALLAVPASADGRGPMAPHHETLAIAALHAGDLALGADLIGRAEAAGEAQLPDERLERATAHALLALARRRPRDALQALRPAQPLVEDDAAEGSSLRVRAQFLDVLALANERAGRTTQALHALRAWQRVHQRQAQMASRARYQAATLQTELLRLQHALDAKDAERRATERAQSALVALNTELQRRIEQVQALQTALRQQATQDALTGLFNRRHLNDTLPTMLALAARDGQPLALAIIDLDHFKAVNDGHGHDAGDRLLAAFGALLALGCRRSDIACRYGGEEFCLLLPRSTADGARRKVQALLRRWRATRLEHGGRWLEGLSFSAGVADTLAGRTTPAALLKAADDALLEAKRSGRNRVRLAVEPGQAGTHAHDPGEARC